MVIFHSYAMLVYQRVKSIESQSLKDFLFLFPNKKDDWWHNDFWCPPTHMFFVLHVVSVRIHPNIEHCNAFSQWCIRIKDLNRRKFMTNAGSVGWWTPNCFAEGNSDCRLYPNTRNGGKTGEKGTVKWPFSWDQFPFLWLSFTYKRPEWSSWETRLTDKQGCNPFTVGYLLQLLDSHDVPSSKPVFWRYSIYIHFVGLMSHFFLISKDVMCQVVQMNSRLLPSNSHFWFPPGKSMEYVLTSGNHCNKPQNSSVIKFADNIGCHRIQWFVSNGIPHQPQIIFSWWKICRHKPHKISPYYIPLKSVHKNLPENLPTFW